MQHLSDDSINQARAFLDTFLEQGNNSFSKPTAILALAAYKGETAAPVKEEQVPVKESDEFKALQETLDAKFAEHDLVLKQRDHNWNELQKANVKIKALEVKLADDEENSVNTKA